MGRALIILQLCYISIGFISSEDSWPLYRVSTVLHEPWVMKNETGYRGFIVDLLDELGPRLRFQYKLQLTNPGQHDNLDYIHGKYDSIVQDVQKKVADVGAADVMVTDERLKRVSFSRPFISTGAQLLIKKPPVQDSRTLLMVFAPFSLHVWVLLAASLVLVVLMFYLVQRMAAPSGDQDTRCASLYRSMRIVFSPLCIREERKTKRSMASIILEPFWWVFVLLTTLMYLANLTSLLVKTGSDKPVIPFKTFTQLAHQSDVTYGGWFGMPLNPAEQIQRTMNRFISSRFSYYTNIDEAVTRVRKADRPFAAILSGTEGEYLSNKHCDLMLLREQLFPIEYAIVCPHDQKGGMLCGEITMALHSLADSGVLQQLMQKWWTSAGNTCPVSREEDFVTGPFSSGQGGYRPVTPRELGPVFTVLLCGLVASCVVLIVEAYRSKKRKQVDDNGIDKETGAKAVEQPMLAVETDAEDGTTVRHIDENEDNL